MNKHKYILTFGLISLGFLLQAQQIAPISKLEVLNRVKEENRNIKISQEAFNQAKAEYRQTNAVFLPNIAVSHTGFTTTNPLMAFGSKLNQGILTQGDFNPDLLNNPSQTQNFATRLEVEQPLINMDGFYQRKAAKSKMESTSLQSKRITDYINFEVDKAYMQLQLAYKAVDVLEKALESAQSNKTIAVNSFKQGYRQRADVLAVEVRVTEVQNQLQTAKSNVNNASNYLSFLMNDNSDVVYQPSDVLSLEVVNLVNSDNVSTNRADIKAMEVATEAYKTMHKADGMAFLPTLNAFGSYELYDDQIFQGDASGYLVGAQLKWNIFEGFTRFAKSKQSKAQFEKSKLEYEQYVSQSEMELKQAKRLLTDAENRLKLTSLALEQSDESLRIRTNRFKEGLETTSDLLISETQYAQKQLEYYQTIFEFNYAQSYLEYLTKSN
ncbi:TolC family protein [Paucihalobacter sp.]|uniref:TolC family protein n=1 Tax=Paucihalobacter sp. TaxID=2850405 RepID=UPI002FE31DC4